MIMEIWWNDPDKTKPNIWIKDKIILNYIGRFSSYRAVNSLFLLGYRIESVVFYNEIFTVCSEIHTHNTLMHYVSLKPVGTQSNHWALKVVMVV
jgi:hypothetical protein